MMPNYATSIRRAALGASRLQRDLGIQAGVIRGSGRVDVFDVINRLDVPLMFTKLKGLLGPLGCHETFIPSWSVLDQRIPLAGVAHQCGTVRFGTDPETSALNVDCRAHDVDNLYVVDTSFFPSIGAVNPALTAMANALRVGDHLLERLGAKTEATVSA